MGKIQPLFKINLLREEIPYQDFFFLNKNTHGAIIGTLAVIVNTM